MTKADTVNSLAEQINGITAYIEELKKERAVLMAQLSEYVCMEDVGHLTHMHATTAGRIVKQGR